MMLNAEKEKIYNPLKGFSDVYGYSKRLNEYIKCKIAELFQLWGYDWIEIPIIEKLLSFDENIVGLSPWPEWNKRECFYVTVNDYQNDYNDDPLRQQALLIPEGTVSVARWVAKQIMEGTVHLPIKLFYITPCFRNELLSKLTTTKMRQFDQIGLEIVGLHGKLSDLECILLITKGLEVIGFDPLSIEIRLSDVSIFNRLVDISNLSLHDKVVAKEYLDVIAEERAKRRHTQEEKLREHFERWINSKSTSDNTIKNYWMSLTYKDGLFDLPDNIT